MKPVDRRSGGTILSVVIPAFNVEHYIGAALKSALAQPRSEEIELIVVDDGSTDGTLAQILKVKESAPNHQITVIHQENQGVSAARNVAIARATSPYLGFLDSDDEWAANFTDVVLPLLDAGTADIIEFNVGIVDVKGRIVDELGIVPDSSVGARNNDAAALMDFARICEVHSGARVYRRSLWDGIEFPVNCIYEDACAIPRVYVRARTLYGIPDQLYYYRRRAGSITQTTTLRAVECVARFAGEALELSETGAEHAFWFALFQKFFDNQCFLTSRVDADSLPAAMKLVEATAAKYRVFAARQKKPMPPLRYRTQITVKRGVFQMKRLVKRTLGLDLRPPVTAARRIEAHKASESL